MHIINNVVGNFLNHYSRALRQYPISRQGVPKSQNPFFGFQKGVKEKKQGRGLTFVIDIYLYIYKYISIHLVVVHLRISKNVKKGLWDFLCKRAQSQACLSYAKRSQKSRLQVVIFLPLFTGIAEICKETRRADSGIP